MPVQQRKQFKLSPPRSSVPQVEREQLQQHIAMAAGCQLVLVTSPAGYGKTIFLTQWYEACHDKKQSCAWLTLDKNDSDRLQFVHSILQALRTINDEIGIYTQQLLDAQVEPELEDIINHLCSDFYDLETNTTLIMDEYDCVDAPGINAIMEILIKRVPPYVQFIIASRQQPGLPVIKMQLQNVCNVISVDALRFSISETSVFFKKLHQLDIEQNELQALIEKSEGWIAGLQLVMLSAKSRKLDRALAEPVRGDFREIADYLANDVLSGLPASLQEFLIKSSILDQLNAELCEALTGQSGCQRILEQLESANLFLTPIGGTRRWYRLHQLFREFLQSELAKSGDISRAALYLSASSWFEKNGMPEEAIDYALNIDDQTQAIRLVEVFAEEMIRHGQIRQIISWVNKISPELTRSSIRLSMIQVWALFHLGRTAQGQQVLQDIISRADNCEASEQFSNNYSREKFEIECLTLKACLTSAAEDFEAARIMLSEPQVLPDTYPFLSGTYSNALAAGSFSLGMLEETIVFSELAQASFSATDSTYGKMFSECLIGLVAMARGKLSDALLHFESGEQLALADTGGNSYCCGLSRSLKGVIFYLRGQFTEARQLLNQNLPLVSGYGYVEIWTMSNIARSHLFAADYQWSLADDLLKRNLLDRSRDWAKNSMPLIIDERIWLALRAGDTDAAERHALSFGVSLNSPMILPPRWERKTCLPLRARARLALALRQPKQALEISSHLLSLAEETGNTLIYLQILILHSLVYAMCEEPEQANEYFMKAVSMASSESIIAPFLEEGLSLISLIDALSADEIEKEYSDFLNEIKTRLLAEQQNADGDTQSQHGQHAIRMTARELDVLSLLADGIENREIGRLLSISEHTVKWHVRNILEKLGVSNRMKAVLVAREDGLIPP